MRKTSHWLALSAIAALAIVLVSFPSSEPETAQEALGETTRVMVQPVDFEASAADDSIERAPTDQLDGTDPAVNETPSIEANMIVRNAVDMSFFEELDETGAAFELLTEEFRNSSDPRAIAAGNRFRELFLMQDGVMNGSVVVENLECGTSLCAVEFRALNEDELNLYARDVLTSPDFTGGSIFQPYLNSRDLPDSFRQYIFSHDGQVRSIVFPDGSVYVDLTPDDSDVAPSQP